MTEREKVVAAVECCFPLGSKGCQSCPYVSEVDLEHGCTVDLAGRIIAQLKVPEARVMTLEELTQIKPWSVYWGEGLYVRNLWPMAFTDEAIKNIDGEYLKDSYGRAYELDLYNKDVMGWRIWSARPTEEQRKAVLWDG